MVAISASVTRGESRRQATQRSPDSVVIVWTLADAYRPRPGPPPQARIEPFASCDTLYLPAWSLLVCFVAISHDLS